MRGGWSFLPIGYAFIEGVYGHASHKAVFFIKFKSAVMNSIMDTHLEFAYHQIRILHLRITRHCSPSSSAAPPVLFTVFFQSVRSSSTGNEHSRSIYQDDRLVTLYNPMYLDCHLFHWNRYAQFELFFSDSVSDLFLYAPAGPENHKSMGQIEEAVGGIIFMCSVFVEIACTVENGSGDVNDDFHLQSNAGDVVYIMTSSRISEMRDPCCACQRCASPDTHL